MVQSTTENEKHLSVTQAAEDAAPAVDLLGTMKGGHVCPVADGHYAWAVAEIERLRSDNTTLRNLHIEREAETASLRRQTDANTQLLARWLNIGQNGMYGEKTKTPLRKHPIITETAAALGEASGQPPDR